jgi:parallel beta-helix repeat protein
VTVSTYFDSSTAVGGAFWFSSQGLTADVEDCLFFNNTAYSGWGGGIYLTGTSILVLRRSTFKSNGAISSYTNGGQGGAIMASYGTTISVTEVHFAANVAMPRAHVTPQTYSGEGGAIFAQSSSVTIHNSSFFCKSFLMCFL